MEIAEVEGIPGALLATLHVNSDERGSFTEIIRESALGASFVQANHSVSREGVLRGLHYHRKQADAWYVIRGKAQAMLVDLRTKRDKVLAVPVELTEDRPQVLYIPPGVAHGYLALTDLHLVYWVTHYYDSTDEFGVAWDDPALGAPWKNTNPVLSERDRTNPKLDWDEINL